MFIWLAIGIAVIVLIGTFIYLSTRKAKEESEDLSNEENEKS